MLERRIRALSDSASNPREEHGSHPSPTCLCGQPLGALVWPVLIVCGAEEGGMWHVTSETLQGKLITASVVI